MTKIRGRVSSPLHEGLKGVGWSEGGEMGWEAGFGEWGGGALGEGLSRFEISFL